jgi:hypothetical protein
MIVDTNSDHEIIAQYEALTYDEESGAVTFAEGGFKYVPPIMYYHYDGMTRTIWEVSELLAVIVSPVRTGSKRNE